MPLTADHRKEAECLQRPLARTSGKSSWPDQRFLRQSDADHDRARHYSHVAAFAETGSGRGLPPVPTLIFRALDQPPPEGLRGAFPERSPNPGEDHSCGPARPPATGEDLPTVPTIVSLREGLRTIPGSAPRNGNPTDSVPGESPLLNHRVPGETGRPGLHLTSFKSGPGWRRLPGEFLIKLPPRKMPQAAPAPAPGPAGEDAKAHLRIMAARNASRLTGVSDLGKSTFPPDKPAHAGFPAPAASPHSTQVLEQRQPAPTDRPGAAQASR